MTESRLISDLCRLLWERKHLPLAGVGVEYAGDFDPATGNFTGAELTLDGVRCLGAVVFGHVEACPAEAVLHIVEKPAPALLSPRGTAVRQAVATLSADQIALYMKVRTGFEGKPLENPCAEHIRSLDAAKRLSLFTRLYDDRMERKHRELLALLERSGGDWNQTVYLMLFRAMGGSDLKEQYGQVASRVPYHAVAHEKGDRAMVEAMLLGAAGLLRAMEDDHYTVQLKAHFDHACRKYGITPMDAAAWHGAVTYAPPVLRLVQIAGFLVSREFIFDRVRSCRTPRDLYGLLRAGLPDYWLWRYPKGSELGKAKIESLGINMVVPLMYAYSLETANGEMREAALGLLEQIPPENNRKTIPWKDAKVNMQSAHDTQAILELTNEYCTPGRCRICPVGRITLKNL